MIALEWAARDRWPMLTLAAAAVFVLAPVLAYTGTPPAPQMWLFHRLGLVLPGCGLTRGVVNIVRGDVGRAWDFNPAAFLVVVGAAGLLIRFAVGTMTAQWLTLRLASPRRITTVAVVAAAVLWAYQQSNAQFVIHQTS